MPDSELAHSPQFSPARPKNGGSMYLRNQSEAALVYTPHRSRALINDYEDETASPAFAYSPSRSDVQQTPVYKTLLNQRRDQHALMSPLRRKLTEAERERDELCHVMRNNFVALDAMHAESKIVLGLQAECFQYQSQIMRLMSFISRDTTGMNVNIARLREMRNSLENLRSNLQATSELLQTITSELPAGNNF